MSLFDPRAVPVVRHDTHLQAVPASHLTVPALKARFANPPDWTPEVVKEQPIGAGSPTQAAVLIAVVRHPVPTVLLTMRARHLKTHSGQIAFPGGKLDSTDPSVVAAALREANEEVGLSPHEVDVFGCLPVYVTGTGFVVTPVVGVVSPGALGVPNLTEVEEVFEVPLAFLMNPAHHRLHRLEFEGLQREWYSIPYPDAKAERFIWGATAGMLRNLYRFLSA